MTDLKFIVAEVNKLINTDYNMISFDALPIANLVQILVDVLHDFGALSKVNYQLIQLQSAMKNNLQLQDDGATPFMDRGEWCARRGRGHR